MSHRRAFQISMCVGSGHDKLCFSCSLLSAFPTQDLACSDTEKAARSRNLGIWRGNVCRVFFMFAMTHVAIGHDGPHALHGLRSRAWVVFTRNQALWTSQSRPRLFM